MKKIYNIIDSILFNLVIGSIITARSVKRLFSN